MTADASRRNLCLRLAPGALALAAVLIAACGSTDRAAPITDLSPAPDVPRSDSAVRADTSKEPNRQPVPTRQTAAAAASASPPASEPAAPVQRASGSNEQRRVATRRDARPYRQGDWRPEYYTVRKGDTLYSIALDFGHDYRDLAAWNDLVNPAYIQVGQRLRLFPSRDASGAPAVLPPAALPAQQEARRASREVPTFSDPKAYRSDYSEKALAALRRRLAGEVETAVVVTATEHSPATPAAPSQASGAATGVAAVSSKPEQTAAAAVSDERLKWAWPATGKLLYAFSEGPIKKGVAIEGTPGQSVVSSAPGKVVYSGSGLRGYGNLIIVKHNATYLSVYAHNRQLLVSEGQRVAQGQKIAVMGEIAGGRTALHFEIRRLGKPIDPLKYLPDRPS